MPTRTSGPAHSLRRVDTLIFALLVVILVVMWRGGSRRTVLILWFIGLVAMLALFKWHVTDPLGLSF